MFAIVVLRRYVLLLLNGFWVLWDLILVVSWYDNFGGCFVVELSVVLKIWLL